MLQGKFPLLIALALGVMAGAIAYSAIVSERLHLRQGWNPKRVLCARQDMEAGTEIDENLVDICEMPEKFTTDSFIVVPEAESPDSLIPYGERIIVPLKRGDPLLFSHFEVPNDFPFAATIPPRARAISIKVSEETAVNQLIRPNDHVDVLGIFRDPENGKMEQQSTIILQNVIVLATGHHVGTDVRVPEGEKNYTHVALLVTAEESEVLFLAAETGTLSLSLRNPTDGQELKPEQLKKGVADVYNIEIKQLPDRMGGFQGGGVIIDRGPQPPVFEPWGAGQGLPRHPIQRQ